MNVTIAVTVAGDVILAATLIVFMRQSRYMTRSIRSTVYQTMVDQMISIDRLFVERPELRRYFYGNGLPPAEAVEGERVSAVTELFLDFMDHVTVQSPHIPEYHSGAWQTYFRRVASTSPSIRAFWRDHREWYGNELHGVLDPVCLIDEELMQAPADRQSDDQVAGR